MSTAIKRSQQRKRSPSARKTKKGLSVKWKIALIALLLLALSPFYYGYVIKSITSSWRWMKDIGSKPNYRTYKSFNIRIPSNYKIHGIDVSSYQGRIDWQKVKNMREDSVRINFAFIKATEGIALADPYFQRNWREAAKAGITCGAYHFFRPRFSGRWQARFFMQNAKLKKGNLPMVVDIEVLDGVAPARMREELKAFLREVEIKTKVRPIIYTGLKYYQDYLSGYFDNYTLWLAHYYHPELLAGKTISWDFWQHSNKARVTGIAWVVDFDVFNGDSLAFKKLLVR